MATWSYLLIGLFLPLFPLSMAFNLLFARVAQPLARAALLLAWPLVGLCLLHQLGADVPQLVLNWALATSALYAVRLLALRDLGTWTGFLATSVWALLWIPAGKDFELVDIGDDFRNRQAAHTTLARSHAAADLCFDLIGPQSSQGGGLPNLAGGDLLTATYDRVVVHRPIEFEMRLEQCIQKRPYRALALELFLQQPGRLLFFPG
mgnify:CR=1 FL=1